MTLKLILTRHAKSSWKFPDLDDHARPLNKRGRASAKAIGRWMVGNGYAPDEVHCSDAERTRETWALIADMFVHPPQAKYTRDLYLADPDTMRDVLRQSTAHTMMIVAHNPGSAYLAQRLAKAPYPHPRFHHYPSGATAIIEFSEERWSEISWGSGQVIDFIVPRDLI